MNRTTATALLCLLWFGSAAPTLARSGISGHAPDAVDDFRRVGLSDSVLTIQHADLLTNDLRASGATLTEVRSTVYGDLESFPTHFEFTPTNSFWSVGSDSLVYQIETNAGTSMATLHLAAERPLYSQEVVFDFETPDSLQENRSGVAIETGTPLIGRGSLSITAEMDDVYSSAAIDLNGTDTGEHEEADLDLCAGGLANVPPVSASHEAAGYFLLLGSGSATVDSAAVRVGLTADASSLFVEVQEADPSGNRAWHRSPPLTGNFDTVRLGISYRVHQDQLVAMLRANGLVVRSIRVPFYANRPSFAHIGFFQPEGGTSTVTLLYDRVRLRSGRSGFLANALYDPIQMADDFEEGNLDQWTHVFGSELIADKPSALTGEGGMGVIGFSGSPAYVAFRHSTSSLREVSAQARIGVSSFAIASGTRLAAIAVMAGDNPWFSSADYQLRIGAGPNGLLASIWYRLDQHWVGSLSTELGTEPMVRLQVGKSDGPNMNNGWLRLWRNGEIALEQKGLANDGHALRNVLFGGQSLSPNAAWGTLRFDDVSVTR